MCEDSTPESVPYLHSKVIPAIWEKDVEPQKQHQTVLINWTNNRASGPVTLASGALEIGLLLL